MFVLESCNTLQNITQTLTNVKRIEFKLGSVSNVEIAGISVTGKSKITDFSILEGAKLTAAFVQKDIPMKITANVLAKNPNTGNNSTMSVPATLAQLDWNCYIDNVLVLSGDLASPVQLPSSGQEVPIPLSMNFNAYTFFGNQGYEKLVNLALTLGGVQSSISSLKIDAKPTVTTSLGNITYPQRITIVEKEYTK